MPSQRPFFLSAFFAAFRQQPGAAAAAQQANRAGVSSTAAAAAGVSSTAAASVSSTATDASSSTASSPSVSSAAAAAMAASQRLHATRSHSNGGAGAGSIPIAAGGAHGAHSSPQSTTPSASVAAYGEDASYHNGLGYSTGYGGYSSAYGAGYGAAYNPAYNTGGVTSPDLGGGRRRGSDSSSEGFRDVTGADKWYIGGRTAGGEERFFKLGVVRRVRSGDRLSLDRLSL